MTGHVFALNVGPIALLSEIHCSKIQILGFFFCFFNLFLFYILLAFFFFNFSKISSSHPC